MNILRTGDKGHSKEGCWTVVELAKKLWPNGRPFDYLPAGNYIFPLEYGEDEIWRIRKLDAKEKKP